MGYPWRLKVASSPSIGKIDPFMKLLKSKRAYKIWEKSVNSGQPQAPITPPAEFPCYAYLTVGSYSYEEDVAEYLYLSDLRNMINKMASV